MLKTIFLIHKFRFKAAWPFDRRDGAKKKGSAFCRALVIGGLASIERYLESLIN